MTSYGTYVYPSVGWAIHGELVTVTQISSAATEGAGVYLVSEGGYAGERRAPAGRHFVMDLGGLTGQVRINGQQVMMSDSTVEALCALADAVALAPDADAGSVVTTNFNVRTDRRG